MILHQYSAHLDTRRYNPRPGQLQQARDSQPGWGFGDLQEQESLLQSEVCCVAWMMTHYKHYCSCSCRSDITIVCKAMEFGQFPLDNHKCYLMLTSCE